VANELQRTPPARVQRLSILCPYCGADDTRSQILGAGNWRSTVIHCDWCQSDWDPLDFADLSGKKLIEVVCEEESMVRSNFMTELGSCCACGSVENVVNIISLQKLCPIPGRGWGCFECGRAQNGAIAVTCENCGPNKPGDPMPELKYACKGYPATDGRVAIDSLGGEFDHDYSKHPEVQFCK